jgi:hypothetical protein
MSLLPLRVDEGSHAIRGGWPSEARSDEGSR